MLTPRSIKFTQVDPDLRSKLILYAAILENSHHLGFTICQSDSSDYITIEMSHTNFGVLYHNLHNSSKICMLAIRLCDVLIVLTVSTFDSLLVCCTRMHIAYFCLQFESAENGRYPYLLHLRHAKYDERHSLTDENAYRREARMAIMILQYSHAPVQRASL